MASSGAPRSPSEGAPPRSQSFDASQPLTALEQDNTNIAVIEMSKAKWLRYLVGALFAGTRHRGLRHPHRQRCGVARAPPPKTGRLDTEQLVRAFLGWLRSEKPHCSMAAIPTHEEEDAQRPNRERESLVGEQTRLVNRIKAVLTRFGIRGFA